MHEREGNGVSHVFELAWISVWRRASIAVLNALFCNVIVVKIPLTLLGEFLLEANFRMFYFSKGSFVRVITLTMTHPMI